MALLRPGRRYRWNTFATSTTKLEVEEWQRHYQAEGFLVTPQLFSKEEVRALATEIAAVARGDLGEIAGLVPAEPNASDDDVIKQYLAIHHPHKVSDLYRETMHHPRVTEVLEAIVSPNVKTMQSMFFVKAPGKPGQAWHQDEFYIPTRDRSLVGCWIALDDATVDNGCLFIHPGSHERGVLHPMKPHADPRFDPSGESFDFAPFDADGGTAVEVKAGDVVWFNGYTLHRSLANTTTDQYRRALVVHYMSAESLLPWDCDGAISPTQDNRDVIIVAGKDPHAYKGYVTDITTPFIRPDAGADFTNKTAE